VFAAQRRAGADTKARGAMEGRRDGCATFSRIGRQKQPSLRVACALHRGCLSRRLARRDDAFVAALARQKQGRDQPAARRSRGYDMEQNVGSKRGASESSGSGGSGKIAAKSHEAAEQLKDAVVGQAKQLRDNARSTQDHTSDRIRNLAEQLRGASDNLRERDALAAGLVDRASQSIEDVASYVRSTSPRDLVRDAEQLARRQPALFFGSALLLGLAAGRFLKSSAPAAPIERVENEGGALATRQDRESGFFPLSPGETSGSQRYRENYDATFARDSSGAERATPERESRSGSPGKTAGRGERP
jgi:hypothetical protein